MGKGEQRGRLRRSRGPWKGQEGDGKQPAGAQAVRPEAKKEARARPSRTNGPAEPVAGVPGPSRTNGPAEPAERRGASQAGGQADPEAAGGEGGMEGVGASRSSGPAGPEGEGSGEQRRARVPKAPTAPTRAEVEEHEAGHGVTWRDTRE